MLTTAFRDYDVLTEENGTLSRVGRVRVPLQKTSHSGTLGSAHPRDTGMAFEYDPSWIKTGFSLGFDLPLSSGIHRPLLGESTFLFLRERELNQTLLSLYERFSLNSFPENALPVEKRTLIAPQPPRAIGGFVLWPVREEKSWGTLPKDPREGFGALATPLLRIPHFERLLWAWQAFARGKLPDKDLKILVQGTGLPGRHIKCLIQKDNREVVLRARHPNDLLDTPFWKTFALQMGERLGLRVVKSALMTYSGQTVSLSERFDRSERGSPLVTLNARTLASRRLTQGRPGPLSYLSIADILNREGAAPQADLLEMYKRLLLLSLVGPSGDTPERWQFVRTPLGWRLAPAYALDWVHPDWSLSRCSLTLEGRTPLTGPDALLPLAPYFALTLSEAKELLATLQFGLSKWETYAMEAGASINDVALMARLFD